MTFPSGSTRRRATCNGGFSRRVASAMTRETGGTERRPREQKAAEAGCDAVRRVRRAVA